MNGRWHTTARICALLLVPGFALAEADPESEPGNASSTRSERLLSVVRERTVKLELREQEVAAREQTLDALEAETLRILEEARAIRLRVEQRIEEWEAQLGDRVARLAKVYAEMPANRAAPLLEGIGLDLATEVVARMKPKDSAAVLAKMSEGSALRISKRVARPLTAAAAPAAAEETR